jgi:hypothetical protein
MSQPVAASIGLFLPTQRAYLIARKAFRYTHASCQVLARCGPVSLVLRRLLPVVKQTKRCPARDIACHDVFENLRSGAIQRRRAYARCTTEWPPLYHDTEASGEWLNAQGEAVLAVAKDRFMLPEVLCADKALRAPTEPSSFARPRTGAPFPNCSLWFQARLNMTTEPEAYSVADLEKSLNDSATRVSAVWVSFIFFALYLVVSTTTVTLYELQVTARKPK